MKLACSALKHADEEISERVLRLDNGWLRFEHQLSFTRRIQHLMDQQHQETYYKTLMMYSAKLELVTSMLRTLVHQDGSLRAKKIKYAWRKESLDEAIEELEVWQRTTDHSWFLLMRIADPGVDAALANESSEGESSTRASIPSTSVIRSGLKSTKPAPSASGLMLPQKDIQDMMVLEIPTSAAKIAKRIHPSGAVSSYVFDEILISGASSKTHLQRVKKDARDLVRRLQHDEPETFGLLTCKGFVVSEIAEEARITLVLRTPTGSGTSPRSLRDALLNNGTPGSLSRRFEIAKDLAKSVGSIHTFGFVHKNIRPESILLFTSADGSTLSPFLVGFDSFRRDEGHTEGCGDDILDRNLYRHPSRQGAAPDAYYIMQHDIYSLGICLLEIGFWESFFKHVTLDGETRPVASELLWLPPDFDDFQAAQYLQFEKKDQMVHLARNELPQIMGSKYADIVVTCLTCLDPDNVDFGDEREFQDEDGIGVGVRYIEKVSGKGLQQDLNLRELRVST